MTGSRDWAWMGVVALLLGASAHAAKMYSFSGKVSQISGNEIEVTRGSESRQFGISGMNPDQMEALKVGEEVTLWYSMEAKRATRQQPGRARSNTPQAQPELDIDESAPAPPAIQDDRAFYNAKMDLDADQRS